MFKKYILYLLLICTIHVQSSKILVNSKKDDSLICDPGPNTPKGPVFVDSGTDCGPLGLIGDVNDVLQGRLTDQARKVLWNQKMTGSFGFGAASHGPLEGTGEAIFANGIAFIRSTDNRSVDYFKTIPGPNFQTPFSLFILPGSKPSGNFYFNGKPPLSMQNLYESISLQVGQAPFCFSGLIQFDQVEAIAISKAPIYNEPIFGDPSYYSRPNFQLKNQFGYIFGCAANFQKITDENLKNILGKMLYFNPMDSPPAGNLVVHSHVVTLKKCLKNPNQINQGNVRDVYHLLSNSSVSVLESQVYIIDRAEKLIELNSEFILDNKYDPVDSDSSSKTLNINNLNTRQVIEL